MIDRTPNEQRIFVEETAKEAVKVLNITLEEAYDFASKCLLLDYDKRGSLKNKVHMDFLTREDIFKDTLHVECVIPRESLENMAVTIAERVENMVVNELFKGLPKNLIVAMLNSKYGIMGTNIADMYPCGGKFFEQQILTDPIGALRDMEDGDGVLYKVPTYETFLSKNLNIPKEEK